MRLKDGGSEGRHVGVVGERVAVAVAGDVDRIDRPLPRKPRHHRHHHARRAGGLVQHDQSHIGPAGYGAIVDLAGAGIDEAALDCAYHGFGAPGASPPKAVMSGGRMGRCGGFQRKGSAASSYSVDSGPPLVRKK